MRKVQVFKYEKIPDASGVTRSTRVTSFIGTFHQFGVSYEEFENGTGNFTTLIIERDDGTIFEALPHVCQFIEPAAATAE